MSTKFPEALDTFDNPSPDSSQAAVRTHSQQHSDANDAVEALQLKVGVDQSADPDALDFKVGALENFTDSLGSAAFEPSASFATAGQGSKADTAVQPAVLQSATNELQGQIDNLVDGQQTSAIYADTLEDLQAVVGTYVGQGAFVVNGDGAGQYSWNGSVWAYLGPNALALKLDIAKVPEVQDETRQTVGVVRSSAGSGAGSVEVVLDSNGDSRIVAVYPEGDGDPQFLGETPNAWKAGAFGIGMDIPSSLDADPDHAELIADADGELRVLQALGGRIKGPVIFGAAGGSPEPPLQVAPTEFVVFLIAGQSNAQGIGKPSLSPIITEGVAYQYWSGSLLPLVADPVGNADTASAWPAFALEFYRRTGMGVIFVPAASGNSGLTIAASSASVGGSGQNWTSSSGLRSTAMTRLQAAKTAADASGLAWRFGGVLWSQGERDSRCLPNATSNPGVITEADYLSAFDGLVSYFNAQIGDDKWPFIMAMTGGDDEGIDDEALASMRALQRQISRTREQVRFGWTGAYNLIARGLMRKHDFPDGTSAQNRSHYSQQGYNEMGAAMATVAATIAV